MRSSSLNGWSSRKRRRAAFSVVVATAVLTTLASSSAPAATVLPAPTLRTTVTNPTASQMATFAYQYPTPTDGITPSTPAVFQCSLDSAAFTSCAATGITYTNLAARTHTFQVQARAGASAFTKSSVFAWTIDRTAAQVAITFPASAALMNGAVWGVGCGASPKVTGICGTAADPSGVGPVVVSVRAANGTYWDGARFIARTSPLFLTADGTTSWRLPISPIPADGRYSVSVRATDQLGNASSSLTTSSFTIDTVPPRASVLITKPEDPTPMPTGATSASALFTFTPTRDGGESEDEGNRTSVRCSIDDARPSTCTSPFRTPRLPLGKHCFKVSVSDAAANVAATEYCWWHIIDSGFGLTGQASKDLFPGSTSPVNLTFTNPYGFELKILTVTVTVLAPTTKNDQPNPQCSGLANLSVTHSLTRPVVVPVGPNPSSLSQLIPNDIASWPEVKMPNLNTNQDACKNTTFSLRFSGTATKA